MASKKTQLGILVAAFAWTMGSSRAHDLVAPPGWQPALRSPAAEHAASPTPDRIVLTWADDPATTQAVSWRTDTSVYRAVAELAVAGDLGPKLEASRIPAQTEVFQSRFGAVHRHSVQFTGLDPSTLYAYRVGDGANWSEWFHFRTASRDPEAFTFIYFGDAQNDVKTHWSRVFREAFREASRAAFTLHAGDLINNADADEQWGEWFGAPAWVNGSVPVVATPGNHEYMTISDDSGRRRVLSAHWRPQFAFPLNGPPGLEESVYYVDYQGARIIVLNSNERQEEQIPWLRRVLTENQQAWTILTFHHPVFSPATDRDNATLRNLWKPLLDEFRVDLVLTGHDHTYARSGVVEAPETTRVEPGQAGIVGTENTTKGYNQVYDPEIGTIYVVSVSGPKMYKIIDNTWARRMAVDTQLFQIITVDGDTVRYEARTATNRLYDAFELRKHPGRPNELIELLPDDPSNRN